MTCCLSNGEHKRREIPSQFPFHGCQIERVEFTFFCCGNLVSDIQAAWKCHDGTKYSITSVTPRNTTSGPLPIPRLRRTLNADEGIIQMRSSRQRTIAQSGDCFSWLLPTLLCLTLIASLISVGLRSISRARALHALQGASTESASDSPLR